MICLSGFELYFRWVLLKNHWLVINVSQRWTKKIMMALGELPWGVAGTWKVDHKGKGSFMERAPRVSHFSLSLLPFQTPATQGGCNLQVAGQSGSSLLELLLSYLRKKL